MFCNFVFGCGVKFPQPWLEAYQQNPRRFPAGICILALLDFSLSLSFFFFFFEFLDNFQF